MKEHLFFMAALAGCVVFLAAVITEAGRNLTTPSGLKVDILQEGNGPVPQKGQTVVVHYTGTLENGKKFDSSRDRGEPFSFVLGAGQVIRGWDEGLALMNVGSRAQLTIPPQLGYRQRRRGTLSHPMLRLYLMWNWSESNRIVAASAGA